MAQDLLSQIYAKDDRGREVLVGLTYEETIELAILDAMPPKGQAISWEAEATAFPPTEARWLELYFKHQDACKLRSQP